MKKSVLKVGTLLNDNGKMAVISKVIEVGELRPRLAYISWRANYEITYADGSKLIIGCRALEQMINNEAVEIYYDTTTPLPFVTRTQAPQEGPYYLSGSLYNEGDKPDDTSEE